MKQCLFNPAVQLTRYSRVSSIGYVGSLVPVSEPGAHRPQPLQACRQRNVCDATHCSNYCKSNTPAVADGHQPEPRLPAVPTHHASGVRKCPLARPPRPHRSQIPLYLITYVGAVTAQRIVLMVQDGFEQARQQGRRLQLVNQADANQGSLATSVKQVMCLNS